MKRKLNSVLLIISVLLSSCSLDNKKIDKTIATDIVAFAYLPYPTMDIILNNIDFGVGSGDVSVGASLKSGEYYVYWHDAGTGEEHKSINKVVIPESTKKSITVLHIYPNNEAEIEFTDDWPTATQKGLTYRKEIANQVK